MSEPTLPENGYFRFNEYRVDVGDHRIFDAQQSRHIEPKAMQVLYLLALHAGETVSRQELMDKVWHKRVVMEDALTRVISQLRLAFNDNKSRQLIQTVPKKGYRLAVDITWLSRQAFLASAEQIPPVSEAQPNTGSAEAPQQPTNTQGKIIAGICISLVIAVAAFWLSKPSTPSLIGTDPIHTAGAALTQNMQGMANADTSAAQATTVAFLPWRNLTGDPNNDYLAEMLPAELSVTLAKSDKVSVLTHYSSLAFASNAKDPQQSIDHAYLVQGSITQASERIRLLVKLVDTHSSNILWSEVYEDNMQALLALNAAIIQDISTQLFGAGSPLHTSNSIDNLDITAYKAYLKGNYWWMNGKTSEWFARAVSAFKAATQLAPNFAQAHGSLAFVYARYNYHDLYMPKNLAITKARSAIDTALNLEPKQVNALLAQALLAIEDTKFEQAERSIEQVLRIQAKHSTALYVYSELALAKGDLQEAMRLADAAHSIDPLSPWLNVNKAIVHLARNEVPAALAVLNQAISIDKNYTWAYVWQAKALQQAGDLSAAIQAMTKCMQIDPDSRVNSIYLAMLHTQAGDVSAAQTWFSHTASLYGDSADARFWQNYLTFREQDQRQPVVAELLKQVSLKRTRFFNIEQN